MSCLSRSNSEARVSASAGHYLKFWRCVCKPGIKINSDNILEQGLLPDIRYLSNADFHFQQDGALAHRSRRAHYPTIAYLRSQPPMRQSPLKRKNDRQTVRI